MFPTHRPRRLRSSSIVRDMVRETRVDPSDLIYPLFVQDNLARPEPLPTLPGQNRHNLESLLGQAEKAATAGVKAILLFGIPDVKDAVGSGAYAETGIIQKAVAAIKNRKFPLLVATDVCLCEYTSHGHCGIIKDGEIDNDASIEIIATTALSHAQAGADIVAPSDMMDGRVKAIRETLDSAGLTQVAILSYAAKYASSFYGPFREAAGSAPQFGDRLSYQMDPANKREALKEVLSDIDEGADMVMVKPALAYLDIVHIVKQATTVPVAAYNVSGEYAMIEFAAHAGALDRERAIREVLVSIKRAGADLILTYHALEAAKIFKAP